MNDRELIKRLKALEKEVVRMSGITERSADAIGIDFNIKDTEFLLRMLNQMQIPGPDLQVANDLQSKVQLIHTILMEKGVTIK